MSEQNPPVIGPSTMPSPFTPVDAKGNAVDPTVGMKRDAENSAGNPSKRTKTETKTVASVEESKEVPTAAVAPAMAPAPSVAPSNLPGPTMPPNGITPTNPLQHSAESAQLLNLYICHIPEEYQEENLQALFQPYGNITRVQILKNNLGKSRGVGFIHYEKSESAATAIAALNNKTPPGSRTGVPIRVEYAKKKSDSKTTIQRVTLQRPLLGPFGYAMPSLDTSGQAPGGGERLMEKNVYVAQLPPEFTKEQLQSLFSQFGTITECSILKDNATGLGRGVGFVHFASRDQARLAISRMNNHQLPGHSKQLRVKLARDTKKTREQSMGGGGAAYAAPTASNWSTYQQPQGYGYGYSSTNVSSSFAQNQQGYPGNTGYNPAPYMGSTQQPPSYTTPQQPSYPQQSTPYSGGPAVYPAPGVAPAPSYPPPLQTGYPSQPPQQPGFAYGQSQQSQQPPARQSPLPHQLPQQHLQQPEQPYLQNQQPPQYPPQSGYQYGGRPQPWR